MPVFFSICLIEPLTDPGGGREGAGAAPRVAGGVRGGAAPQTDWKSVKTFETPFEGKRFPTMWTKLGGNSSYKPLGASNIAQGPQKQPGI